MTDTETRLALLERSETEFRKIAEEAKESRKGVWNVLDNLRVDFLNFKGDIRSEVGVVRSEIGKVIVKVGVITGICGFIASAVIAFIIKKYA